MTRSKWFALALIILLPFAVGCASSGMRKPTVFVDKSNNIPADIPLQFDSRYERFISDKEMSAFHKLQTDEERQAFIDKFWAERDPDPATSENEYKQEIDERIENIANERFFGISNMAELLFRSNGGFRGDMANVYLLHGEPDAIDIIEGQSFVNMMLWIYANHENGNILYAFLFYNHGGSGVFSLFSQDFYQLDQCGALYEIATLRTPNHASGGIRSCPDDLYRIYEEIWHSSGRGGVLDGPFFAWALFNFSMDPSLNLGKALKPPKSASEIARESQSRVVGEAPELTGTAGTDYILASCEKCNSFIPAKLQLGKEFTLVVRRGDIDWWVVGDQAETDLKIRVVLYNTLTRAQLVFEKSVIHKSQKDLIIADSSGQVVITFLTIGEVAQIPVGTYQVSVYVKNMMTGKYNAWIEELTK